MPRFWKGGGRTAEVEAVDLLEEVVPGGGGALLVGAGVPGGGTDHEGVELREGVGPVDLRDVLGLGALRPTRTTRQPGVEGRTGAGR